MSKNKATLLLFLVSIMWGGGCIAIKLAVNAGLAGGQLNMYRGFFYALLMLIFFSKQIFAMSKKTFVIGLSAGVFNFLGFLFQAIGAAYTTPAKSSFLTTISVVMVPFIVWAMYGIKPKKQNILAVFVCAYGMAVMTSFFSNNLSLDIGDTYTIIGSFFFGMSVIMLSRQPKDAHFSQTSFLLAVCLFIGGGIYAMFFEGGLGLSTIHWKSGILPLAYLVILSNFIAQSLQVEAQRHIPASTASLIMTLEGVFGTIFSISLGFEPLTKATLVGGTLIFVSLIISEYDFSSLPKRVKKTEKAIS